MWLGYKLYGCGLNEQNISIDYAFPNIGIFRLDNDIPELIRNMATYIQS